MRHTQDPDRAAGGIFLIGLALLFITRFWWPGIMFVIAATIFARTLAEGKSWQSATGAWFFMIIGLVFWLPINLGDLWPLILVGIGLFMLFGKRPNSDDEDAIKHKNDII